MMIALYIMIGFAVGGVVLYLLMDRKMDSLRIEGGKKDIELSMRNEQLNAVTSRVNHLEEENKTLHAKTESQGRELELLHQQMETAKGEKLEEQQKRDAQFMNMAQQVLEKSASKLKESNTETMAGITQPLKEAITNMQKAIAENQKDSAAHSASFREQIQQMMQQTQQLGEKAESLTNVLRRDNKVSGNMGEIILGDLLASQGLSEGIHYEVQARLRDELGRPLKNDETGKEMQPDVILHYPQGQDAIVDSKVSLVAYEKYVNAETPEDKERYLQEHIKSVRSHVNELARKDYSKYIKNGRETVDFVITSAVTAVVCDEHALGGLGPVRQGSVCWQGKHSVEGQGTGIRRIEAEGRTVRRQLVVVEVDVERVYVSRVVRVRAVNGLGDLGQARLVLYEIDSLGVGLVPVRLDLRGCGSADDVVRIDRDV